MSTPSDIAAAFSLIATNVAVVTLRDDQGDHGATANVWAEPCAPPLLLLTLQREGHTIGRVKKAKKFAINLLSADQGATAKRFAGPRDQRFVGIQFRHGRLGQPILEGCLAVFECRLEAMHAFGDHDIVVGTVVAARGSSQNPLLHFRKGFHALTPVGERH